MTAELQSQCQSRLDKPPTIPVGLNHIIQRHCGVRTYAARAVDGAWLFGPFILAPDRRQTKLIVLRERRPCGAPPSAELPRGPAPVQPALHAVTAGTAALAALRARKHSLAGTARRAHATRGKINEARVT